MDETGIQGSLQTLVSKDAGNRSLGPGRKRAHVRLPLFSAKQTNCQALIQNPRSSVLFIIQKEAYYYYTVSLMSPDHGYLDLMRSWVQALAG